MPHHGPARVFESRLGETTQARCHLSSTNLEDVLGACTYRSRSLPPSCRTVWTSILQACKETMRKACESLLPPRRDRSLLQSQKPRAAQMTRPAWSNVPRLPESFDECCFASTGVVYLGLHHTLPLCVRSWGITLVRGAQRQLLSFPGNFWPKPFDVCLLPASLQAIVENLDRPVQGLLRATLSQ